ncbi:putative arginine--tRNA ligase, cytoplasmic-like isoform X1 [Capsicum annuum]|nr:putative arginine--tRNA ligase, cytoplasmic-like isoform X1 [Capsicum annuum]
MPPSGVQVGSVYDGIGDPTTPGWPSTGECERLSDKEVENTGNVPLIPLLPISWADGDAIIRTIGGKVANVDWQGGEDSPIYRVGLGPAIANLSYEVYDELKRRDMGKQVIITIQNVIAVIEGEEEPDRFVILGNHRDAWTFGAVDPNSGTATLLMIGLAEWVEENREMLAARVVAYLNVDCAVQGGPFRASATPQLDDIIIEAARQVQDPDNSSQTIYQSWLASDNDTTVKLGRLGGAGSDYAAFVQHIGTPALDMSFGNDDEVLPFNYLSYAIELQVLRAKRRRASVREVRELNDRLIMTERRASFKDMIYAPTRHNDYVSNSFPGISDAIERAKASTLQTRGVLYNMKFGELLEPSHKPH